MAITRVSIGTVVEAVSSQSITPSLPGSLQDGDVVIFACTVPGTSTATEVSEHSGTPTNWTQIGAPKFVNDTNIVSAYYRIKTSGWSTMPTISTTHAAGRTGAVSLAYRGVNGTTPLDVAAVFSGTTTSGSGGTSLAMTGVTTATNGAMLISFCILDSSTEVFSPTAPSGMTFLATTTGTADGTAGRGISIAEETRATAGATGTRTWSWSTSVGNGGYVFALKPGNTQLLTASVSTTGVLAKAITKNPFTASSTATGAATFLKVVVKIFTASATATGVLKKVINKTPTASVSTTGAFIKVPSKKFTASTTATGFFRKSFIRVMTASISTTGTLSLTLLGRVFGRPGIARVVANKASEVFIRIRRS